MIPAVFNKLTDPNPENPRWEKEECVIMNFIPGVPQNGKALVLAVALNPDTGAFFSAPMQLFTAKLQQAPTIARPTDVV